MTSWQAPEPGEPLDPNVAADPPGYGYPPATGYPPAAYGTAPGYGYPPNPGYPPYGYPPAPGYPPFGYPSAPRDVRPGIATASGVLAFVAAGLLVLAGLLLFLGGAIANDLENSFNSGSHIGLELALDGVVNLVAAGLLIAGGVMLMSRNPHGRTLLSIGGVVVVAAAFYWIVRFDDISDDGKIFDAAIFFVLSVLSVVFAWSTSVTRWLPSSGGQRQR